MPREIVLLAPVPPGTLALVEAGAAVDPELTLRSLHEGGVHQVVRSDPDDPAPEAGTAVLSLSQPRRVDGPDEVRRLLPVLTALPGWTAEPFWWVDAVAPWGDAGRAGLAVAQEMATRLGGVCVVQDGE
ncbi:hypothetical protein [Cellulomonas oligotrophica]|uniref:Uncharacterized protein n=1 Tax=Cellulomonas oligotrophica TaxID=931536 RepID=A0A7Y9FGE7_9CELL|nr:hypothetical protein [Cellulomonas oligotrophica]NYD86873.1 hypothetical protein [Cellulomonas oligotrophica]GIG32341.1 hypothetical protein Col01nite_15000 [Cellulomonas oligotrophica]